MEFQSLNELFQERVQRYADKEAYRYKKDGRWVSVNWRDYGSRVRSLALSLVDLGLAKGDKVSIISETRPEWDLMDKAVNAIGGITVGIYQTIPANQVQYVLSHCEARAILIENKLQFDKVMQIIDSCPSLEIIVVIDPQGCEGRDFHCYSDLAAHSDEKEQRLGQKLQELGADITPDDPITYIYTSGTTGPPKGAILTHLNFLAEVEMVANGYKVSADDLTITWLPMAHVMQRALTAAHTWSGSATAYAESVDKLVKNLGEVRPTIFYAVPRIYEKAYSKIVENAESSGGFKTKMFHWSVGVGREVSRLKQAKKSIPALLNLKYSIADKLVFAKIRQIFGGRIRFIASGAAPISTELLEFFDGAGLITIEAYGATETTCVATYNEAEDNRFGTVGRPGSAVEVKLAPDSEILLKGPIIFTGYYKEPELTKEALSPEGWYYTGDVGTIDEEGFLRITDRKRDIIITAGGKNVAPQNLENMLKESPVSYTHLRAHET